MIITIQVEKVFSFCVDDKTFVQVFSSLEAISWLAIAKDALLNIFHY